MLEKSSWFHLTSPITLVLLMWKLMGLQKNQLLRCWGWCSSLNCIWGFRLSLLVKVHPRKMGPWFALWSLLRLLCISINLPYGHACNIVVMSRLVLLVATWKITCYKNGYAGLCWSFPSCVSWTLGLSSKSSHLKSFL